MNILNGTLRNAADGNEIVIKTSSASKIRLLSGNRYSGLVRAKDGEELCEGRFKLAPVFNYFRIEVTDSRGEKAYTNAYFIEDINREG